MTDANVKEEDIRKSDVIEIPEPVVLEPGKRYRFRGKIYRAEVGINTACDRCALCGLGVCGFIECVPNNTILTEEK